MECLKCVQLSVGPKVVCMAVPWIRVRISREWSDIPAFNLRFELCDSNVFMITYPQFSFFVFSKPDPKAKEISIGRKKFNMDPKKVIFKNYGSQEMFNITATI